LTRGHLKKIKKIKKTFKKNLKIQKKPPSDTWHTSMLTRVHLKKILKKI